MSRQARELSTSDFQSQQRPPIIIPDTGAIDDDIRGEIVHSAEALNSDYLEALAFGEQEITIRIERSSEKHAPKVREVWVNGKGAEQLINGKWVTCGWLPVGVPVTTKRKYAEVLARAKIETVSTEIVESHDGRDNMLYRVGSATAPFTVLKDQNPLGAAWVEKLMWEQ
jgi:hypothetical protein